MVLVAAPAIAAVGVVAAPAIIAAGPGASAIINGGVDAAAQYGAKHGNIDWLEVGVNTGIGYASPGLGWIGNASLNAGGSVAISATNNYLDGKEYGLSNLVIDGGAGAVGGALGWKFGNDVTNIVDRSQISSTSARWVVSSTSLNQPAVLNTTLGLNWGYGVGATVQAGVNCATDAIKKTDGTICKLP